MILFLILLATHKWFYNPVLAIRLVLVYCHCLLLTSHAICAVSKL